MEHSHVGSSAIRGQQDDRPRVPLGSIVWQLLVRRGHLQTGMTLLIALGLLAVQWANLLPTPWLDALGLTPQGWWHLAPLAVIAVACSASTSARWQPCSWAGPACSQIWRSEAGRMLASQ